MNTNQKCARAVAAILAAHAGAAVYGATPPDQTSTHARVY